MAVAHPGLKAPVESPALAPEVGDEVEVLVRSISSGGAGVAELPDGRVVFVHRTAPGDRARVRVASLKKSWGRGTLVEVLEPGPGRREAPCPHYDRCGGCTLEHLEYPTQLTWKGRLVAESLERIGRLDDVEPPVVAPSPHEFRYRNRVSFHLRRLGDDRVVAGFHELDNPGRIIDIGSGCLLPEPQLADIWSEIRDAWGPGARRLPAGRALRLTLRSVSDGALLLVELEEGNSRRLSPDPAGSLALHDAVPDLQAVWWRRGPADDPVLLAGTPDTGEVWGDRRLRVGPTAFLQVNRAVAWSLQAAVMEELTSHGAEGRRFVDGYCGVGAFGRRLADLGADAVGIEMDAGAATTARRDAPDGFTVLEGRVEERLPEALPADAAVMNPPRTGLHESVPGILRDEGPERLVYVSCDPPTLARDIRRLDGAYRLTGLRAFDLFPQTAHVETVATLQRSGGAA